MASPPPRPDRVAVVGAGSWGTALAVHLAAAGVRVDLHARDPDHVRAMRRERRNRRYLAKVALPDSLEPREGLSDVDTQVGWVIAAIPSHALRDVLRAMSVARRARGLAEPPALLLAVKGVEVSTHKSMLEVALDEWGADATPRVTVLGGPSFAAEVASGLPSAVVVAGRDAQHTRAAQRWLAHGRMRVYSSDDPIGVEFGGAFKNVVALAAGICDGVGLGMNARAGLITRGLGELTRLAVARGARAETLSGLAGLGDLVLTCTGDLSRNRRVGLELGKGRALAEILAEMGMVAEGVINAKSAYELSAATSLDLPIIAAVHAILYEGMPVDRAVEALISRDLSAEFVEGSGDAR